MVSLALGCLLLPGGRLLAAPDADELPSHHYRAGNKAFAAGQIIEAYEAYQRAFELRPSFDVACNLGRTEVELGKVTEAAQHLAYCLRHYAASGRPELRAAREKFERLYQTVRQSVCELRFDVTPEGGRLVLDERVLGTHPLAAEVFVVAGAHHLRVSLPGHRSIDTDVTCERGTVQALEIVLQPLEEAEPQPSTPIEAPVPKPASIPQAPRVRGQSSDTTVLLVGSGVTVAGLGLGLGALVASMSRDEDADRLRKRALLEVGEGGCADASPPALCRDLEEAARGAHTYGVLATAGFSLAAVAAVGTSVWLWLAKSPEGTSAPKVANAKPNPTNPSRVGWQSRVDVDRVEVFANVWF